MIMPLNLEQIRRFLGRTLQDPYGRTFGKVVGISANLRDEVTGVGIEVGNGEFVQCPGDRVAISGDSLVLTPSWKVEAEEFRKEFDVVTRRLKALDELFSVGDIQKDVYEDLRKQHEDAINELKSKRKQILDNLSQSNKAASDAIDTGLARAAAERKDVESIYNYLSKPDGTCPSPTSPVATPVQAPVSAQTPTPQTPARDQVIALHVRET